MAVRENNANYFRFFRARHAFVVAQSATESIEGFVIWGAAVDALCRIHAGRLHRSAKYNRQCFVHGMLALAGRHALDRIAIPLLHHDLRLTLPAALEHPAFTAYRATARASQIWSVDEDAGLAAQVADLRSKCPLVERLVARNSYAEILYEEYRCCAVHGLELGRKTCRPFDPTPRPHYMNYLYGDDDPRPARHRYRTRIVFPLPYLGGLFEDMIAAEEEACVMANWIIPAYPTLGR